MGCRYGQNLKSWNWIISRSVLYCWETPIVSGIHDTTLRRKKQAQVARGENSSLSVFLSASPFQHNSTKPTIYTIILRSLFFFVHSMLSLVRPLNSIRTLNENGSEFCGTYRPNYLTSCPFSLSSLTVRSWTCASYDNCTSQYECRVLATPAPPHAPLHTTTLLPLWPQRAVQYRQSLSPEKHRHPIFPEIWFHCREVLECDFLKCLSNIAFHVITDTEKAEIEFWKSLDLLQLKVCTQLGDVRKEDSGRDSSLVMSSDFRTLTLGGAVYNERMHLIGKSFTTVVDLCKTCLQ